jgi:hypothetical protein
MEQDRRARAAVASADLAQAADRQDPVAAPADPADQAALAAVASADLAQAVSVARHGHRAREDRRAISGRPARRAVDSALVGDRPGSTRAAAVAHAAPTLLRAANGPRRSDRPVPSPRSAREGIGAGTATATTINELAAGLGGD